eukprot:m.105248 g.105248  ORF g.105248 m.105248 type:complete len:83 (-) comp16859_c0_seq1:471-719(-)
MLVENWDDFSRQAEALMKQDPERTRYVTKYRPTTPKVELKVTDDKVCLQFVTDEQQILKKIINFNTKMMTYGVAAKDEKTNA